MSLSGQGRLEEWRQELLRFIERRRPQGSLANKVTVVFDGQPEVFGWPPAGSASDVKVIFSRGQSADEEIKAVVAGSALRKNMVVVTDDRDIQYAVRALGARVCGVSEFLGKGGGSRAPSAPAQGRGGGGGRQARQPEAPADKHIPTTIGHQITSEMEKIWLKDKKKAGS